MISKEVGWRRWIGYRRDLLRAVETADAELKRWSGYDATHEIAITLKDRLRETSEDLDSVQNLTRDDLVRLRALTITVRPSREDWDRAFTQAAKQDLPCPAYPSEYVEFRLWRRLGLEINVHGPTRSASEGLANRLHEETRAGAPRLIRFDINIAVSTLAPALLAAGVLVGPMVARGFGLAEVNGVWDAWEVVGIAVGFVLAFLILFGVWIAFPRIQLLDDGQVPRHKVLRRVIVGALGVGATVLGLALAIFK